MDKREDKRQIKAELKQRFSKYLAEKGMRQTAGRYATLDACIEQKSYFDTQKLYEAVKENLPISLASVYNTVEVLCECGILRKHYISENQAAYELAGDEHVHLICMVCGAVAVMDMGETADPENIALRNLIASGRYRAFSPSYLSASVYGKCADCSES